MPAIYPPGGAARAMLAVSGKARFRLQHLTPRDAEVIGEIIRDQLEAAALTDQLFGYAIQMISVPLLAMAGSWQVAALLIVAERIGRATRNPPRDVMLSHAGKVIGFVRFPTHSIAISCVHRWTKDSARVMADALDALGRVAEAAAIIARYGLSQDP